MKKGIFLVLFLSVIPATVSAEQHYGGENCNEYYFDMRSDEPAFGSHKYFVTHSRIVPVLSKLDAGRGLTTSQWSEFGEFMDAAAGHGRGNSIWNGVGSDLHSVAEQARDRDFDNRVDAMVDEAYCPDHCKKDHFAYMHSETCRWFMEGPQETGSNYRLGVDCYGLISGQVNCIDDPKYNYVPTPTPTPYSTPMEEDTGTYVPPRGAPNDTPSTSPTPDSSPTPSMSSTPKTAPTPGDYVDHKIGEGAGTVRIPLPLPKEQPSGPDATLFGGW